MRLMKQRSTTPVSKGLVTKSALVAGAVLVALSIPISFGTQVYADRFDDQINALQREIDGFQVEASKLKEQANTLQNEISNLVAQKNVIQAQIELSQAQYDKLVNDIKETERKIAENKEALGQIIADMYVDGTVSPLEMLASSNNIGDYVDQQEYRSSIQNSLSDTIDQINKLKKQLEEQKVSVERVLADQKVHPLPAGALGADCH